MRRPGRRTLLLAVACLCVAWPGRAAAQSAATDVDVLTPVRSMGKPPRFKPFTGGFYGLDRSGETSVSGGGAYFGVFKDLMPSIVGVGVSAEGYLGGYSDRSGVDGGVRASAELRSLFLKLGVDHDLSRDDTSFLLSLTVPLRRSGILGRGTH